MVAALAISAWRRLGLSRQIVWAAARALVQLLAVGGALELVIDERRSIWWSWAWVVAMVAFAAWTTTRRAPEVPGLLGLAAAAYTAAAAVSQPWLTLRACIRWGDSPWVAIRRCMISPAW